LTGETQDGVGYYQLTQRWYRRSSTATAYLKPALSRPNLTVRTGVQVRRIVVENGRAVGRGHPRRPDPRHIARSSCLPAPSARQDCLQLSGIGPADHLAGLGIPVVLDQPAQVGANLQDHVDLFVIAECTGPHTYDRYAKPHWSALAGLQYLLTPGPVASSLFETGGFWYADPTPARPDIQFHLGLGSGIEAGVAAMPQGGVTLNSAFLRPRSRGTVRLASADPMAAPLIDPNYWARPL
jgi:choline dehydrogenase